MTSRTASGTRVSPPQPPPRKKGGSGGISRRIPHGTALAAAAVFAGLALAEAPPPTRLQTLDGDLSGPRIDWSGQVVGTLPDGDDTCLVLQPSDTYGAPLPGGNIVACSPGRFDGNAFAPGAWLRVKGNLGAAMPRAIGGQVLNLPVVAGAFIQPGSPPAPPVQLYGGVGYYSGPGWYGGPRGYGGHGGSAWGIGIGVGAPYPAYPWPYWP